MPPRSGPGQGGPRTSSSIRYGSNSHSHHRTSSNSNTHRKQSTNRPTMSGRRSNSQDQGYEMDDQRDRYLDPTATTAGTTTTIGGQGDYGYGYGADASSSSRQQGSSRERPGDNDTSGTYAAYAPVTASNSNRAAETPYDYSYADGSDGVNNIKGSSSQRGRRNGGQEGSAAYGTYEDGGGDDGGYSSYDPHSMPNVIDSTRRNPKPHSNSDHNNNPNKRNARISGGSSSVGGPRSPPVGGATGGGLFHWHWKGLARSFSKGSAGGGDGGGGRGEYHHPYDPDSDANYATSNSYLNPEHHHAEQSFSDPNYSNPNPLDPSSRRRPSMAETIPLPPPRARSHYDFDATDMDLEGYDSRDRIVVDMGVASANAKLSSPLAGIPKDRLMENAREFAREKGMTADAELMAKAALVAQDPLGFEYIPELTDSEREAFRVEHSQRWAQTRTLYWLVITGAISAAVQGMDEAVINGAQVFFPKQFNLAIEAADNPGASHAELDKNNWIWGMITSAPFICCALIGCWLNEPMNNLLGRRGTIFLTCFISAATCFWQAFTNSWPHLFVARFFLGLGIGPKSATVPVYTAECAPAAIRGALVMMWQMWTAFGIMLGYSANLAFFNVADVGNIKGLNWRLMLASAGIPALWVMLQIWTSPESPRWLMRKNRYPEAFTALKKLRRSDIQAAKDLYYIHVLLQTEEEMYDGWSRNRLKELFTIPRNRRALCASSVVMTMQQLCGINAILYYSTNVFTEAGFSHTKAFLSSWGTGALNWLFALPATFLIDRVGRRFLLLTTFPLMAILLVVTGFGFFIGQEDNKNVTARVAVVSIGIYLFSMVYSPGGGPVPFTYSAEAYPLLYRDIGMSYSTALTWFFNCVVSLTFPPLVRAFTHQGAFAFYAAWNVVGWFLVLLFVPETKALTLEELDAVFSVPTRLHMAYQIRQVPWFFKRYILKQNIPKEFLYEFEEPFITEGEEEMGGWEPPRTGVKDFEKGDIEHRE